MKSDERSGRQSLRLKGYDYSRNGAYFLTICVQHRECRFGVVENKEMTLNNAGTMIQEEWLALPKDFPNVFLDVFVVMPNHVHGILVIDYDGDLVEKKATAVGVPLVGTHRTDRPDRMDTSVAQSDNTATCQKMMPVSGHWATTTPTRATTTPTRATTRVAPTTETITNNGSGPPTKKTIGDMLGSFKSKTTNKYIDGVRSQKFPPFDRYLWQRNYYDHIIRNEEEYNRIRQYIIDNPKNWEQDQFFSL